jgi:hypothetical protein
VAIQNYFGSMKDFSKEDRRFSGGTGHCFEAWRGTGAAELDGETMLERRINRQKQTGAFIGSRQ